MSSRLTVKQRKNRRRPSPLWARLPPITVIAAAATRTLRRSLPALAAAAAVGTVGAFGALGYDFVTTSPRFAITDIEIRGSHHLAPDQIAAALPMQIGDNVFAANLDTAARELRADPWVASASLHRVLPHTLVVELREREPVALVDFTASPFGDAAGPGQARLGEMGGLYLVEADGHPFKRAETDAGDGDGLPVITGLARDAFTADPDAAATQIQGALAALGTWGTGRPKIGEVHVDPHGALTFHTYDRATAIQLGDASPQIAERMATFDRAWAELDDGERMRARSMHLDHDQITVALHPISNHSAALAN